MAGHGRDLGVRWLPGCASCGERLAAAGSSSAGGGGGWLGARCGRRLGGVETVRGAVDG
jgi:hypothetical protein